MKIRDFLSHVRNVDLVRKIANTVDNINGAVTDIRKNGLEFTGPFEKVPVHLKIGKEE
jgi:hypothetical protein